MFPLNWSDPYINKNGTRKRLSSILGDIPGIEEDIETLDGRLDVVEGDINTVEGAIDNIADSITPITQTGTEATAAISINDYFFLNGDLVQAKTAIAIGDTFTSGTNYTPITSGGFNDLFDAIAGVNSKIILKKGLVPANSSADFDISGVTLLFTIWNTSTLTITIVNNGYKGDVFGTIPSGGDITPATNKFTVTNPNAYSAVVYYMSEF